MKARALDSEALRLVDSNMLKSGEGLSRQNVENFVTKVEGTQIDYDALESLFKHAKRKFTKADPQIDKYIAERLHRIIRLTPNQAADYRIWNYLSLVHAPSFVLFRWKSGASSRYIMKSRATRHALARPWWIAEQTIVNNSYNLTRKVLQKQDAYQNIFDRKWSHHKRTTVLLIRDVLINDSEGTQVIRKMGEILNRKFALYLEEHLDEKEILNLFDKVEQIARNELDLPQKKQTLLQRLFGN